MFKGEEEPERTGAPAPSPSTGELQYPDAPWNQTSESRQKRVTTLAEYVPEPWDTPIEQSEDEPVTDSEPVESIESSPSYAPYEETRDPEPLPTAVPPVPTPPVGHGGVGLENHPLPQSLFIWSPVLLLRHVFLTPLLWGHPQA